MEDYPDDERSQESRWSATTVFLATSDALEQRVRQVIRTTPGVTCDVLDCSWISLVDWQGVAELAEIVTLAEEEQVTLRLARLKPAVSATLARCGIIPRIAESRIHCSVDEAVQAQLGPRRTQGDRPSDAIARRAHRGLGCWSDDGSCVTRMELSHERRR